MDNNRQKRIISTHLQELALLLLADQPLKDLVKQTAEKNRGRIMADLTPDQREVYQAERQVIKALATSLNNCTSLEMVAKVFDIVQGINNGEIKEYEEVQNQIIEEPTQTGEEPTE